MPQLLSTTRRITAGTTKKTIMGVVRDPPDLPLYCVPQSLQRTTLNNSGAHQLPHQVKYSRVASVSPQRGHGAHLPGPTLDLAFGFLFGAVSCSACRTQGFPVPRLRPPRQQPRRRFHRPPYRQVGAAALFWPVVWRPAQPLSERGWEPSVSSSPERPHHGPGPFPEHLERESEKRDCTWGTWLSCRRARRRRGPRADNWDIGR